MNSLHQIRNAESDDLPRILDIYNESITNSTAIYTYTPHTLEMRRTWFAEKKAANFPIFVTEKDGIVSGFACYGSFRSTSGYKYTVEDSIYIAVEYRGNGLSKILLKGLIDHASQNGIHCMIGAIDSEHEVSIKLHERFGFINAGCLREAGFKFGTYRSVIFMQLLLEGVPASPVDGDVAVVV